MSVERSELNVERSGSAGQAVFLSYASQNEAVARKICEALREAGVEVWFDQSELVGGDAWDAKIRSQIKECVLPFGRMPLISASTQARREGYFRLEWKLAAQRTHMMSERAPFLLPVVIDATRDTEADVPAEFRAVQWTRLPIQPAQDFQSGGEATAAFCARVKNLLGDDSGIETQLPRPAAGTEDNPSRRRTFTPSGRVGRALRARLAWIVGITVAVIIGAFGWMLAHRRSEVMPPSDPAGAAPAVSRSKGSAPPTAEQAAPISEARKLARQAKALIDDDPLLVRENYLAAERLCQRAITIDPAESEAWAVYARASSILYSEYQDQTSQRREGARSRAETALRLAPESIKAGLAMAWYDYYVGGVSSRGATIKRLEALAARAPTERRILELRARIELRAARTSAVDSPGVWAERAEALPGGSPITLIERARFHADRNELPQMAHWIDESLRLRPTSLGYEWKLSLLVGWLGDLPSARALLATLPASLREEDGIALKAFHIELWSRNFDEAVKVLSRVPRDFLEQDSIYYVKGYLLGEALQHAGKLRAAEIQRRSGLQAVEQRMVAEPSSGRLLYWQGKLLARLGQLDDAKKCFNDAGELGVEFSRWSHIRPVEQPMLLGRHEEAMAAAERAVDATRFRWNHPFSELRFDPLFDPLRSDPRFQALIAKGETWLAELQAGGVRAANVPRRATAPRGKAK